MATRPKHARHFTNGPLRLRHESEQSDRGNYVETLIPKRQTLGASDGVAYRRFVVRRLRRGADDHSMVDVTSHDQWRRASNRPRSGRHRRSRRAEPSTL